MCSLNYVVYVDYWQAQDGHHSKLFGRHEPDEWTHTATLCCLSNSLKCFHAGLKWHGGTITADYLADMKLLTGHALQY